ncbi:MAG: cytochrome-c oxidase, cbb3-type subunit I [Prolixibacteraceae bacterium]|nr:cytochrome-c oxidase, cbb3-type subunit I [Prolixibacteraceae bacterium]
MELQKFSYDNRMTRNFAIATIVWGVVGLLAGLLIALQIFIPAMNFGLEFTTFGRTRPVHTNAVIFAFVGNAIFTAVYYSLQRLLKTRMYSETLSKIHFWGWQAIIVAAAVTLLSGFTVGKEYAELEWPIDIAITLIWVVFGWNMFGTILQRRTSHIYVSIWFYIATWVTVAVLHIFNSLAVPVSFMKSYTLYAGVQDALVQWWYGHNAVAFFLTTPFLGLMYYFVPKVSGRPVYSYKLSIVHFWSLIFLYIWAGPHHLLYSSLPDWLQALGTTFSVMLIAPSWGGMINGLLTLRGAWDKVRRDPILKMFVVGITAYGMATFEGPMLSFKTVNAISHFTDWTIGHVHIGALGWNGMLTFGMIYWLVPRLYNTKLYSVKLANIHFWLATLAIVFYAVPLYIGGITQALMWKQFTPDGFLKYPNFLETVAQLIPMYTIRAFGGALYLTGFLILVFNIVKTIQAGSFVAEEEAQAPALHSESEMKTQSETWHRFLERKPIRFLIFATIAILIGGVVEVIPTYLIKSNIPTITSVKPYTPLELQGRDIYVKEGCYNCHSQMVRPFRSETERYGEYSKAGESVYDHPFQFGSKRTGPDLAREGVKTGKLYKPNAWHYNHFIDPQKMNEASIMPKYPWLAQKEIDIQSTPAKIRAMKVLGVPYPDNYEQQAIVDLKAQADSIAKDLGANGIQTDSNREIIALIAYIQRLGVDISNKPVKK